MPTPAFHTQQPSSELSEIVLADGMSCIFRVSYDDLVKQPPIDLSGSCSDKSSPFPTCFESGQKRG